jgi:hypothetical protein
VSVRIGTDLSEAAGEDALGNSGDELSKYVYNEQDELDRSQFGREVATIGQSTKHSMHCIAPSFQAMLIAIYVMISRIST